MQGACSGENSGNIGDAARVRNPGEMGACGIEGCGIGGSDIREGALGVSQGVKGPGGEGSVLQDTVGMERTSKMRQAAMHGKSSGPSTRWLVALCGGALVALVFGSALLDGPVRPPEIEAAQGLAGTGGEDPRGVIFNLGGPNDGEPINSRTVTLEVRTNFESYGSISIHVNGIYLSSRPLQVDAEVEPATGLLLVSVTIDLEEVQELLAGMLPAPEDAPLRVRAYLYDAQSAQVVAFDEWEGYVNRPWLEVVTLGTGDPKTRQHYFPPPGVVPALVHTLKGDSYCFVFAATSAEALKGSPEDGEILREARVLSGGSCDPSGTRQQLVMVDTTTPGGGEPVLVAVWTYDAETGWKRSPIVSIPAQ